MTCPPLNRFLSWDHDTLAQLAQQLHTDNQMLLKRLRSLTADVAAVEDCSPSAPATPAPCAEVSE